MKIGDRVRVKITDEEGIIEKISYTQEYPYKVRFFDSSWRYKPRDLEAITSFEEKIEVETVFGPLATEITEVPVDVVNRPSHYNQGSIETIEAIEDWNLGYHLGNALKYVCRAGKKDPSKEVEDLNKAIWYINRKIKLLEGVK